jgi:hypothetical protein
MKFIASEKPQTINIFKPTLGPTLSYTNMTLNPPHNPKYNPWGRRASLNIQNMSWGLDFKMMEPQSTSAIPRYVRTNSNLARVKQEASFSDFEHIFQGNALFKSKQKDLNLIKSSAFRRNEIRPPF